MKDKNESAAFTAHLNHVSCLHSVTGKLPEAQFGNKYNGILVETGAAHGSSAGAAK